MTAAAHLAAVPFPFERWAPRLVADPDIEGGGMHHAWAGGVLMLRYARPSDSSLRRLLVRVDNGLVRLYSTLKRSSGWWMRG
jgi:hypothetical protein